MAVLVLFLGLFGAMLVVRQKEYLLELGERHATAELTLMGTLAREALIKGNYVTVEQFFNSWGTDNPDVLGIQAVAENGFVLALYGKEREGAHRFEASRDIYYSGRKLVSIKLAKDFSDIDESVSRLRAQGAAALLLFTAVIGAALWFTLRRTTILPMEKLLGEVNDLNQSLEKRVEERTADIVTANATLHREMSQRRHAQDDLLLSKKALEQQNEELKQLDGMKDSLIKDISHELKTPVAKHLMQLEILADILAKKGVLDSVSDVMEVMGLGIRRQQAAIQNILLVSRLEEGGRKQDITSFRLDELLDEVVNDYIHGIASYGIRLQTEVSPLTVVSDRELLWHVFANLVHNSIKYRNREDPRLLIQSEETDGGVVTRVIDNGVGFSEEEHGKAFERFYQSSPATEGVGLGLNIVGKIIEKLGGSISIESGGKNMGTTVSVTLPAGEGVGLKPLPELRVEQS